MVSHVYNHPAAYLGKRVLGCHALVSHVIKLFWETFPFRRCIRWETFSTGIMMDKWVSHLGISDQEKMEIIALLQKGWRIRTKKSKGRNYSTIRKGNKEKSLGSFDQERHDELLKIQRTVIKRSPTRLKPAEIEEMEKRMEQGFKDLEERLEQLQIHRSIYKANNCAYVQNKCCTFWRFDKIPEDVSSGEDIFPIRFEKYKPPGEKEEVWVLKMIPYSNICKHCSMYKPKK